MSCTNPLYARRLGAVNSTTGKERIKILPHTIGEDYFTLKAKYGDDLILLPCGKCKSCIEARSKTWALRCVLEASYHKENYFLTLTYDQDHVTKGLVKRDLQLFFKRLRQKVGSFRYYAVGEFGGRSLRPHFHCILFGCNLGLSDLKVVNVTDDDYIYYVSKTISKVWPFGIHTLTDVTFKSCAYTARYCEKKLHKNLGEFSLMSLKPGIGTQYFLDHYSDIYKNDVICTKFGSMKPSRYFDKLLEKFDTSLLDEIKEKRLAAANSLVISDVLDHGFSKFEDLMKYKAELKEIKFSRLKRNGVK